MRPFTSVSIRPTTLCAVLGAFTGLLLATSQADGKLPSQQKVMCYSQKNCIGYGTVTELGKCVGASYKHLDTFGIPSGACTNKPDLGGGGLPPPKTKQPPP